MSKLYVIAGATASGKTSAAVALARRVNGEVVSADSMQVYRHMNIGTAKPTAHEMEGIPHHLIDVIEPCEPFSVAQYQKLAIAAIQDIHARGKIPILAGGTGFYINAVLYGTEFSHVAYKEEMELRQHFTDLAHEKGAEYLHKKLAQADPEYAAAIHPNNVKRVARALAYCQATGKLFSVYNAEQSAKQPVFDDIVYTLTMKREILYSRINARTHAMFEAGLADEVQNLLDEGYHEGLAPMRGIGYKEVVKLLRGEYSLLETIAEIQQSTRRYAKRQETWFRNQSPECAFIIDAEGKTPEQLADEMEA